MRSAPVVVLCLSDPSGTWTATPSPTRAGPTGRAAGPSPTGTSTPAWPRCPAARSGRRAAGGLLLRGAADRHDAVHEAFGIPAGRRVVGAGPSATPRPTVARQPAPRSPAAVGGRPRGPLRHPVRAGHRWPHAPRRPAALGPPRPTPAATARQNGSSVSSAVSIPRWVSATATTSRRGSAPGRRAGAAVPAPPAGPAPGRVLPDVHAHVQPPPHPGPHELLLASPLLRGHLVRVMAAAFRPQHPAPPVRHRDEQTEHVLRRGHGPAARLSKAAVGRTGRPTGPPRAARRPPSPTTPSTAARPAPGSPSSRGPAGRSPARQQLGRARPVARASSTPSRSLPTR